MTLTIWECAQCGRRGWGTDPEPFRAPLGHHYCNELECHGTIKRVLLFTGEEVRPLFDQLQAVTRAPATRGEREKLVADSKAVLLNFLAPEDWSS